MRTLDGEGMLTNKIGTYFQSDIFVLLSCTRSDLIIKAEHMSVTTTTAPIKLTEGALTQLKRIMQEQDVPDEYGLRIGVKGGGCSGFSYILGFDIMKEKDQVYELEGFKVFMEKSHGIYLIGMEIDWVEGLNNRGFTFNNPNATESCGCGTSFSA